MRIALIYPPPWKLPAPGERAGADVDGPPEGHEGFIDADFFQMPYGMLCLAAEARRAGHAVKVLNLSALPWVEVLRGLAAVEADVYGLSCYTANRRGVALCARAIKEHHPDAHVTIGGPHATAMPLEMLRHHAEIDTVTIGEGEATFMDLVGRVERREATTGVPGTSYRSDGVAVLGPERALIADLDTLAPPQDHYDSHIVMTSRGCPSRCSFCAADVVWGRRYRVHSVPYVLDSLEKLLARMPLKMLQVKDDTFAARPKRAIEICNGIRERGLRFVWSCDTRADKMSDEVLEAMRLAGCQRLSVGVESGSPEILRNIEKRISPEQILDATERARAVGMQVRYYMMLGNQGETSATFHETLAFLERAKPHQAIFSYLSLYPGTKDLDRAIAAGRTDREVFFRERFKELKLPFEGPPADVKEIVGWFRDHQGVQEMHRESVESCRAVLARLGDHHAAHLDLAGALYAAGDLDGAARHAERAIELGYPCPGLCETYLAAIAARRGDVDAMQLHVTRSTADLQHHVVVRNLKVVDDWFSRGGLATGKMPELEARHDFQLLERTVQPMLPGPLPADVAKWD
jgi:radical SAM superfamily enzyme YgiQ (UPF0313 family)